MVLSRRERLALLVAAIVIGLLVVERWVVSPAISARQDAVARRDRLAKQLRVDKALVERQEQLESRWKAWVAAGLKQEAADAEGQVLHALQKWAEESRIRLTQKPHRSSEKGRLPRIEFDATGNCNMDGLERLLRNIQGSAIPLRVDKLSIRAVKEGADDLAVEMQLSTVYAPCVRPSAATVPARNEKVARNGGRR